MAAKKGKSGPAKGRAKDGSRRGGARPNSGPKPKPTNQLITDVNAVCLARTTKWLPELLDNLKKLADGGYERVEQKFERQTIVPPRGALDIDGKPILPYEEMVLIEQKVEVAEPDRAANEYLINRLLGKPTERKELSGPDGGSIKAYVGFDPDDV